MERQKKTEGYYHCEGDNCDFKCKHISKLVNFRGKRLCHWCKIKSSKCTTFLPTLNPSEATLKHNVPLKDIGITMEQFRHFPKETRKGMIKITPELREWAIKKQEEGLNNVVVSLTKDEHKVLWNHFAKQGLSDSQIDGQIERIKEQIRTSHKSFNEFMNETKPDFKTAFEMMVAK